MKKKIIRVIKESGSQKNELCRKEFPYLGNLLLHQIENQEKVKKDLIFGNESHEPILKQDDYRQIRIDTIKKKMENNLTDNDVGNHEQKSDNQYGEVSLEVSNDASSNSHDYENNNDNNNYNNNDNNIYNDNDANNHNDNHNDENNNDNYDSMDDVNEILRNNNNSNLQVSVNKHENLRNIDAKPHDVIELKREILFKFKMLRKSYTTSRIPHLTMNDSYKHMKGLYDDTLHMLTIDSNVENYKSYLLGGFMLTEFLFGKYFNFNMSGFCQQQILQMNKYNKLLIELGEKTYVPKSSWPVEARIVLMIVMNAGMFIVSKLILKNTGSDILNMISNFNMSNVPKSKKMKSPDIHEL